MQLNWVQGPQPTLQSLIAGWPHPSLPLKTPWAPACPIASQKDVLEQVCESSERTLGCFFFFLLFFKCTHSFSIVSKSPANSFVCASRRSMWACVPSRLGTGGILQQEPPVVWRAWIYFIYLFFFWAGNLLCLQTPMVCMQCPAAQGFSPFPVPPLPIPFPLLCWSTAQYCWLPRGCLRSAVTAAQPVISGCR